MISKGDSFPDSRLVILSNLKTLCREVLLRRSEGVLGGALLALLSHREFSSKENPVESATSAIAIEAMRVLSGQAKLPRGNNPKRNSK